ESYDFVFVLLLHTLVAENPNSSSKFRTPTGNHPSFTRSHVLCRIEAEHCEVPDVANGPAIPTGPMSLSCILKDSEIVFACNGFDLINEKRMAVKMHGHDPFCARRD